MSSTSSRVSDRLDPSWEPNDVLLKVYVTRAFLAALDQFAADLKLSKSVCAREALRRGVPALVNDVRVLHSEGYRPSTHLTGAVSAGPVRGRRGEGVIGARWAKRPAAAGKVPASESSADEENS